MIKRMKKTVLALLLVLSTMTSLITAIPAGAATASVDYNMIEQTMWAGNNSVIKDVDFSQEFTTVDLEVALGTKFNFVADLRLDGITGPKIASWNIPNSQINAWVRQKHRAEILEKVTGVHDLYFCVSSGEVNTFLLTFNYFEGSRTLYKSYADEYPYSDIAELENASEVTLLQQLGIFDNESTEFNPNLPVSRIDFLKAVANFYNEETLPETPVGVFMDVENYEDRKIAYFLYTKGVIVTEDTAYLQPSEYITIYEGAEYAANMLGWAENPTMIRKLMGGAVSEDGYMRKAQMAKVLYNSVFEDYRVGIKYQGNYYYEEYDDGILYENKEYERAEGIVTTNSYTGIYSAEDYLSDYYVRINGETYNIGDTNADTYLGINCQYLYYEDDNGELIIKGIAPKYPETIEIYDNRYEYEGFGDSGITYIKDNGKSQKIKFSSSTRIIYNGKALDMGIANVIQDPAQFRGKIVAIDNDRDSKCDVCVIKNAKSMIIQSVSEKVIVNRITGERLEFGEEDSVEFIRNGQKMSAVDFAVGEAVDIYVSKNSKGKKLFRIVAGSSVEGKLVRVDNSDDEYELENGEIYGLSPYATGYTPSISDIGIFRINSFGEIIWYEKMSQNLLNVGWILSCTQDSEEEKAYMKIRKQDNTTARYQFAEKVTADGVRIKQYDQLLNGHKGFVGLMNVADKKPVLYRLNENDEITIVDTIYDGDKNSMYDQLNCILPEGTYNFYQNIVTSNGSQFNSAHALFVDGAKAIIRNDAISYSTSAVDERLDTFSVGRMYHNSGRKMSCYAFKRDTILADLAVVVGTSGGSETDPFIFERKLVTLDENDETKIEVYGVTAGGSVTYKVNSLFYESDPDYRAGIDAMKKGDMVISAIDNETKTMMTVEFVHFVDNPYDGTKDTRPGATDETPIVPILSSTSDYDSPFWEHKLVKGTITKVSDEFIEITRDVTKHKEYSLKDAVSVVYVSDKAQLDKSGGISSLYEGQTVIGLYNKYKLSTLYIYDSLN